MLLYAKFYTDSNNDDDIQRILDGIVLGARGAYQQAVLGGATPAQFNASSDFLTLTGFYESVAQLIHEQQSYTLGLTYNINPRVKAKLEVAHYENFGSYGQLSGITGATAAPVFETVSGIGRFDGDPNAIDGHTAIYSFSIDAVF